MSSEGVGGSALDGVSSVAVSNGAMRVAESDICGMTALDEWSGFKLVGDNIDKTIKPRDMRLNNQATS